MLERKAIAIIIRWLKIDEKDAQMIYNGVYRIGEDNFSAYITNDDKLEICKNGEPIHRISTF